MATNKIVSFFRQLLKSEEEDFDDDYDEELVAIERKEFASKADKQQENVWVEHDSGEILSHTFGNIKGYFDVNAGGYCLVFYPNLQSLEKGDGSLYLELPNTQSNEFAFAKKTVEEVILKYDQKADQKQWFTEWDILEDFSRRFKKRQQEFESSLKAERELIKKAGYIQGVCECVAAIGDGYAFGKKLLSEMNVTKEMAKKYASPETYKALEQGIFAPQHEQKQEQTHNIRR
jgi:hypothetical protein